MMAMYRLLHSKDRRHILRITNSAVGRWGMREPHSHRRTVCGTTPTMRPSLAEEIPCCFRYLRTSCPNLGCTSLRLLISVVVVTHVDGIAIALDVNLRIARTVLVISRIRTGIVRIEIKPALLICYHQCRCNSRG